MSLKTELQPLGQQAELEASSGLQGGRAAQDAAAPRAATCRHAPAPLPQAACAEEPTLPQQMMLF